MSFNYMGLDIGGANTDCVIIRFDENYNILSIKKDKHYLPFWKEHEKLPECLETLKADKKIDIVCAGITAELADCYMTKKEGIKDITNKVVEVFGKDNVYFVTFNGLKDYDYVQENPLTAAAANWIGTVNFIKYIKDTCIFMDMGTTTTDIIPVKNRKEATTGYSDTQRLRSGELVYTGLLRTNLATITDSVLVDGYETQLSSELFAITADIQRILGYITEDEYTCNTPDGKSKSIKDSKNRVSRIVCADIDTLSDENIENISRQIYEKQIRQVQSGLCRVYEKTGIDCVILSDIKQADICRKAAERSGLEIINLSDHIDPDIISIITTVGAIQMYLDKNHPEIVLYDKIIEKQA